MMRDEVFFDTCKIGIDLIEHDYLGLTDKFCGKSFMSS